MPNVSPTSSRRSESASYADQPHTEENSGERNTGSSLTSEPSRGPVCDLTYFRQITNGLGQNVQPTPAPTSPVTSPNCVEYSVTDVWQLIQELGHQNPAQLEPLLRQIVDRGDQDIQLSVPLVPKRYPDNMEIRGGGMLEAHLHIHNGRISGTLNFRPGLIKHNPEIPIGGRRRTLFFVPEAEITQIDISTDDQNRVRFNGHINVFGFDYQQDITRDMTKTLFGPSNASDTVSGPASNVLSRIIAFYSTLTPAQLQERNLVDPTGARFRVDINPTNTESPLAPLGRTSHARIHLPQLDLGHGISIRDIAANLSATAAGFTGTDLHIDDLHIGEVRHHTDTTCSTSRESTLDAVIQNIGLRNTSVALRFLNPAHPTPDKVYVETAYGELALGNIDLHHDVTADLSQPIRFSIREGTAQGHAILDLQHPNLMVAAANLRANIPNLPADATGEQILNTIVSMINGNRVPTTTADVRIAQAGIETGHVQFTVNNIFDLPHTTYHALFPDRDLAVSAQRIAASGPLLSNYGGSLTGARLALGRPDVTVTASEDSIGVNGRLSLSTHADRVSITNPQSAEILTAGLGEFACDELTFSGHASTVEVNVALRNARVNNATIGLLAAAGLPVTATAGLSASGINLTASYNQGQEPTLDFSAPNYTANLNLTARRGYSAAFVAQASTTAAHEEGLRINARNGRIAATINHDDTITARLDRHRRPIVLRHHFQARERFVHDGTMRLFDRTLPRYLPEAGGLDLRIEGPLAAEGRHGRHSLALRDNGNGRFRLTGDASLVGIADAHLSVNAQIATPTGSSLVEPTSAAYNLGNVDSLRLSLTGNVQAPAISELGQPDIAANVQVRGIQAAVQHRDRRQLHVRYGVHTQGLRGDVSIPLHLPEQHVEGHATISAPDVRVTGTERQAHLDIALTPIAVDVRVDHFRIRGSVTPQDHARLSADLASGTVRHPEHTYTSQGQFTLYYIDDAGHETEVGALERTFDQGIPTTIAANGNINRVNLSVNTRPLSLRFPVNHGFTHAGAPIPEGTTIDLQFPGIHTEDLHIYPQRIINESMREGR